MSRLTGLICKSYAEIPEMIPLALELNRQTCGKHVENNFSVSQMVNGYEAVYRQIIKDRIESNDCVCAANIQF